ncbi:uncharacterized protein METZ01_LOCUS186313, partial [marine metagenome]
KRVLEYVSISQPRCQQPQAKPSEHTPLSTVPCDRCPTWATWELDSKVKIRFWHSPQNPQVTKRHSHGNGSRHTRVCRDQGGGISFVWGQAIDRSALPNGTH